MECHAHGDSERLAHHVELMAALLRTAGLGPTTDLAAERMADAAGQLRLSRELAGVVAAGQPADQSPQAAHE